MSNCQLFIDVYFHYRDPGLFGLLSSKNIPREKALYYSVIADGLHTHPASLRLAYKSAPEGTVFISICKVKKIYGLMKRTCCLYCLLF